VEGLREQRVVVDPSLPLLAEREGVSHHVWPISLSPPLSCEQAAGAPVPLEG